MTLTTPGRIPSPCMNCQARRVGCHADCAAYAHYCEARAELMTKRLAQRHDDALAMAGIKRNLNDRDKSRLQRRAQGKR